jgi:hypothetical protein
MTHMNKGLARRGALKTAGSLVVSAGLPSMTAAAAQQSAPAGSGDLTGRLVRSARSFRVRA